MLKNINPKSVLNVRELIDYTKGGIVSKEIFHSPKSSLTLFAVYEGQKISEHSAPFDATVMVTDGEAEIVISGEKYVVKEGEMIVMPANEPHALNAVKSFKMLLIMIRE